MNLLDTGQGWLPPGTDWLFWGIVGGYAFGRFASVPLERLTERIVRALLRAPGDPDA